MRTYVVALLKTGRTEVSPVTRFTDRYLAHEALVNDEIYAWSEQIKAVSEGQARTIFHEWLDALDRSTGSKIPKPVPVPQDDSDW